MVSIVTKRIKGNEYLYLVVSVRDGVKVKQKTVKYIGRKRPIHKLEFECMKRSFEKKDWILNFKDELSYQDHAKMKVVSGDYKKHLKSLDKVSREKERDRFLAMFISNSNAIEGSTLTVKETFNYLFEDITPEGHGKKELYMATNLLDAWHYVENNCKKLPKKEDLLRLHSMVNVGIETEDTLGKLKKVQNYVGDGCTTSFLFVEERVDELLKWVMNAFKKVDDFEVAFQSHAQFEIIHPFIDGNGRVGRLLLNWLLMNKGLVPFAIPVKKRGKYISAIHKAENGSLKEMCEFCFNEYVEYYNFI
jgi:Fic family protein